MAIWTETSSSWRYRGIHCYEISSHKVHTEEALFWEYLIISVSIRYTLRCFRKQGILSPGWIMHWETSTVVQPAGGTYPVLPCQNVSSARQWTELPFCIFFLVDTGWQVLKETSWMFLNVLDVSVIDQCDFCVDFYVLQWIAHCFNRFVFQM